MTFMRSILRIVLTLLVLGIAFGSIWDTVNAQTPTQAQQRQVQRLPEGWKPPGQRQSQTLKEKKAAAKDQDKKATNQKDAKAAAKKPTGSAAAKAAGKAEQPPAPRDTKEGQAEVRGAKKEAPSGGGGSTSVRMGGKGKFSPISKKPVLYGDVPDVGEAMTMPGNITVSDFLDQIQLITHWNILPTKAVLTVPLRFWIEEMKPRDAMQILKFHDVYYTFDEESNFLYVMTKDEYLQKEYGAIEDATFEIRYTDLKDVESVLTNLLSENGRLITDARTNRIFAYDTDANLDEMTKMVAELDVEIQPRVYQLKYINVDQVADVVEGLLTERGTLQLDPRFNTMTVTDVPINLDRVGETISTLDKQLELRSWVLNYAEPDEIAERLETLIPSDMGEINVSEGIHQITVAAIPERLEEIDRLVREWDIKRRQVQIEAFLVNVSDTLARSLGINWALFDTVNNSPFGVQRGTVNSSFTSPPTTGQQFTIGQFPQPDYARNPITGDIINDINGKPIIEGFQGNNVAAVLSYLDTKGDAKILSHPRVTVQDGEEAVFENTRRVPYVSASEDRPYRAEDGSFTYRTSNRIEFIDVGTILRVLPRITEENNILMDISAEESTYVFQEVIGNGQTNTVPEKAQNKAETQVLAYNGDTITIGGLRTSNVTKDMDRVPVLGDIPLLGMAFRTAKRDVTNKELLIFLTPIIVNERTSPEAEERLGTLDNDIARRTRLGRKNFLAEVGEEITKGKNEAFIAIGQTGEIYYNGRQMKMDKLRETFREEVDSSVTIVIREHPRASSQIAIEIAEAAAEADLRVVYDDKVEVIVPTAAQDLVSFEPTFEPMPETASEDSAETNTETPAIEALEEKLAE